MEVNQRVSCIRQDVKGDIDGGCLNTAFCYSRLTQDGHARYGLGIFRVVRLSANGEPRHCLHSTILP
jgi:hypothetical protein